jgi:hypothetical protein
MGIDIETLKDMKPRLQNSACTTDGHAKKGEAFEGPGNKHGNCEEHNYAHV